jgi:hypothetical protein
VKTHQMLATICTVSALATGPALAEPICVRSFLIHDTKVIDATTIDFHLIDGTVYRNTLPSPCLGLRFHGFVYVTHIDQICDNLQSIRVLESHDICKLGAFSKLPPAPAK